MAACPLSVFLQDVNKDNIPIMRRNKKRLFFIGNDFKGGEDGGFYTIVYRYFYAIRLAMVKRM